MNHQAAAPIWLRLSHFVLWGSTLLACMGQGWVQIGQSDARVAWFGWSPIAYVYQTVYPAYFTKDFPNGSQDYGFSLLIRLYKIAYLLCGVSPEHAYPLVIALEIIILALVAFWFSRAVQSASSRSASFFVVILLVASWARDVDLAQYGHPTFIGLFYHVADGLRLLAIMMVLRDRLILAGVLLAASFVTHPLFGLLGAGFVAAMLVLQPRRLLRRDGLIGIAVFLIIAVVWTKANVNPAGISGGQMSPETWGTLTRFMSFHWYPLSYGMFTSEHATHFLPFLSFLLLFAYYLGPSTAWRDTERKLAGGCVAMVALAACGVLLPVIWPSPFSVKLALHRAGLLVATVGLVYVVHGLYREIESGPVWHRVLALLALLFPFIARPGYPALFTLVLTLPAWTPVLRGRASVWNYWIAGLALAIVTVIGLYVVTGLAQPWRADAYTGVAAWAHLFTQYGWYGVMPLFIVVMMMSVRTLQPMAQMGVALLIGLYAFLWVLNQRMAAEELMLSRAYEEVQLWAREHTSETALFMPDPTIYYGWRDYSRRSSFGNLREWLYSGWAYTSDIQVYQDGMKRFAEFSIDLTPYLQAPDAFSGLRGFTRLTHSVEQRYYTADDDWRMDLARRWGIVYFILRKDKLATTSGMRVAFENDRFIVLQSEMAGPKKAWRVVTTLEDKDAQPSEEGQGLGWSTYSEGRPVSWPWGVSKDELKGQPCIYLRQLDDHNYWLATGQGVVTDPPVGPTADVWRVETPGSYRVSASIKNTGTIDVYLWWYDAQRKSVDQHIARVNTSEGYQPFSKIFELPIGAHSYRIAFLLRGNSQSSSEIFVHNLRIEREVVEENISGEAVSRTAAP